MTILTAHHPKKDRLFRQSLRPAGMMFGVVKSDYETVWEEKMPDGSPVTIHRMSRNDRNEILNGVPIGANWGRQSGDALPATARFSDDRPVMLTCQLQRWIFDVNWRKAQNIQTAMENFSSLFRGNRFMTNRGGSDFGDCINNPNADPPFEFWAQPMMCGGGLFRLIEITPDDYLVEAIHPNTPNIEKFTEEKYPWLWFIATLSARVRLEDDKGNVIGWERWYQEPFHQFGERVRIPVFGYIPHPGATVTGFVNRLPKFRGRILGKTEPVPNPFIMRDKRDIPNPYRYF